MGVTHFLRRLAGRAEARVFCVPGPRFVHDTRLLRLAEGIQIAATPRAANILLIVGDLDPGMVAPALVAHDALAVPRATVWWRPEEAAQLVAENFPNAVAVAETDPVPALRRVHEALVSGALSGEPPLLPDIEPAAWRGLGPYGQGGKAMTGGVPYGRPMAERADDRDGLKLDQLPVRVGPLFAPFPFGFALDVKLQGDVIQEAILENFVQASTRQTSIFHLALHAPVPIRDLEVVRARSHLQWLSDAVAVAGAPSMSQKVLRLAERAGPRDGDAIRALQRSLRRRGFLTWNTAGVGVLAADRLKGVTGPIARASGLAVDARVDDEPYRRLGFEPEIQTGGDAAARWMQRLGEAAQALDLAARAGDERTDGRGAVESPRGVVTDHHGPSRPTASLVPSLIAGMEWGDAVTTIVSLDLDMAEANALPPARSAS